MSRAETIREHRRLDELTRMCNWFEREYNIPAKQDIVFDTLNADVIKAFRAVTSLKFETLDKLDDLEN